MNFRDNRQEYERMGFKWLLDPEQLIDGAILTGGWEPVTTAVIEKLVKPGMVVCDIGANIGYYTLMMSNLVGPKGRVLSFEPMVEPRGLVEWHCERNGVRNAAIFPFALDEKDAEADSMFFNYSWRGAKPVTQHGNPTMFRKLDTIVYALGIDRLDFLKIDVDGYEAKLLRGAAETLRRFKPIIILEVCEYTLRGAAGLPYLTKEWDPNYGRETLNMLNSLADIGYSFLWEEDLSPVLNIAEVLTRFDLSTRSINLVVMPT